DEDEQGLRLELLAIAGAAVADHDGIKRVLALELDDLAVRQDLDALLAVKLVDEVARHRLAQVAAADQEPAVGRMPGEEHRRLTRRVAAAGDEHRIAGAQPRLLL